MKSCHMSHSSRELHEHEQHWLGVVNAMPALCGGVAVLVFGFLIGRLTEPVPGVPGGVPWLSWLVLPLIVGAVVLPLVTAKRAARRQPRAGVGSEEAVVTAEVDDAQAGQRAPAAAFQTTVSEATTELTAAIERVRQEEAERRTAEVARVREALERQHADDLRRARTAVVDSFKAVTRSVLQGV